MAFTVYEVVRVAYQSRSWFVLYAQLRDRRATRTTSLILKAMQERNLCSLGNHYDPEMLAMKVSEGLCPFPHSNSNNNNV